MERLDYILNLFIVFFINFILFQLSQGVLVKVFPSLIKRRKTHFHNLPCGASIILGNNGFIWISPTANSEIEGKYIYLIQFIQILETFFFLGDGGFTQNLVESVPKADREVIARLRNCILVLSNCKMMLYDTSILYAYEESSKYEVHELLTQEAIFDVAFLTQHRLRLQEE